MDDARHNRPLWQLALSLDSRLRPSAALKRLVVDGALDPPMVPLLNAAVAQGLRPVFSCADQYLVLKGAGARELAALRLVAAEFDGAGLERMSIQVVKDGSRTLSRLYWGRAVNLTGTMDGPWRETVKAEDLDRFLLTAGDRLARAELPRDDLTPELEIAQDLWWSLTRLESVEQLPPTQRGISQLRLYGSRETALFDLESRLVVDVHDHFGTHDWTCASHCGRYGAYANAGGWSWSVGAETLEHLGQRVRQGLSGLGVAEQGRALR